MAKKLNKYERIQRVRSLNLNTEENILLPHKSRITSTDTERFFRDHDLSYCSIRTYRGDDIVTPAHPFVSRVEARELITQLHRDNYNIILATPIDPRNCEFAGVAVNRGRDLTIELADGPGTVRRVTHESQVDRRYDVTAADQINDKKVRYCAASFKHLRLDATFEFSWYSIPVGWKKENFIVWEVDDGN